MRTLYIDCRMGAAGDMLTAALMELLPDPEAFVREMNSLGIPGVSFSRETAVRCGITGTRAKVLIDGEEEGAEHHHHHEHEHPDREHHGHHDHEHHDHEAHQGAEHAESHDSAHHHAHTSIHDIAHIVNDHLALSDKVKADVLAVYSLIAEAESAVHGVSVDQIHFHEVGTLDAVADVTAVCLLMEKLSPGQVIVSPVCTGSGTVRCAHGILPVPAPATAYLLKGIPVFGGQIEAEMCTPTGAALIAHFATSFGPMPVMKTSAIGYGMGTRQFKDTANCLRIFLGETETKTQEIVELSCNIDDMTGERTAFAMEMILSAGALDVYTIPIGMKKGRPGIMLCAMCTEEKKEEIIKTIFRHTTTIGIREQRFDRHVLTRSISEEETALGTIRRKEAHGYGVSRSKWEYEDVARAARENGMSLEEVQKKIEFFEE